MVRRALIRSPAGISPARSQLKTVCRVTPTWRASAVRVINRPFVKTDPDETYFSFDDRRGWFGWRVAPLFPKKRGLFGMLAAPPALGRGIGMCGRRSIHLGPGRRSRDRHDLGARLAAHE